MNTPPDDQSPDALAKLLEIMQTGDIQAFLDSDPPHEVLEALLEETVKQCKALGLPQDPETGLFGQREPLRLSGLEKFTRERTMAQMMSIITTGKTLDTVPEATPSQQWCVLTALESLPPEQRQIVLDGMITSDKLQDSAPVGEGEVSHESPH